MSDERRDVYLLKLSVKGVEANYGVFDTQHAAIEYSCAATIPPLSWVQKANLVRDGYARWRADLGDNICWILELVPYNPPTPEVPS